MSLNLDNLEGHQFEDLIDRLLIKMGFLTQGRKSAADGGIDIIAVSKLPLLSGRYIIQCKRYKNPVASPTVRDLYGVVNAEKANKGILITTSAFTSDALEFARDKQLELIDRAQLLKLLHDNSLFISPDETYNPVYTAATMLRNEFAGQIDQFEKSITTIDSDMRVSTRRTFGSNNDRATYARYNRFTDEIWDRMRQSATILPQIVAAETNSFLHSQNPDPQSAAKIIGEYRDMLNFILAIYSDLKLSTPPDLFERPHLLMTNTIRIYLTDIASIMKQIENLLQNGGEAPKLSLNITGMEQYASARNEALSAMNKTFAISR